MTLIGRSLDFLNDLFLYDVALSWNIYKIQHEIIILMQENLDIGEKYTAVVRILYRQQSGMGWVEDGVFYLLSS